MLPSTLCLKLIASVGHVAGMRASLDINKRHQKNNVLGSESRETLNMTFFYMLLSLNVVQESGVRERGCRVVSPLNGWDASFICRWRCIECLCCNYHSRQHKTQHSRLLRSVSTHTHETTESFILLTLQLQHTLVTEGQSRSKWHLSLRKTDSQSVRAGASFFGLLAP